MAANGASADNGSDASANNAHDAPADSTGAKDVCKGDVEEGRCRVAFPG